LLQHRLRQEPLQRPDHSLPRLSDRIRAGRQGPALRPHRPEAQIPRRHLHARPGPLQREPRLQRGHAAPLLHAGHLLPQEGQADCGRGRPPPGEEDRRGREAPQDEGSDPPQGQEDHPPHPRADGEGRGQGRARGARDARRRRAPAG
ncbi:hypothetical protein OY671_012764, partial [Metschnikowia pulcherrima]